MNALFFYLFAFTAVLLAVVAVTAKSVVRGGVALLGTFVSLAGVYLSAGAEFIGIIQLIVYGGAIVVLYLFALMTLDFSTLKSERFTATKLLFAVVLALAVAGLLLSGVYLLKGNITPAVTGAKTLALPLFFKYLLPFEVVSILLLVATVGAVAIGRRD